MSAGIRVRDIKDGPWCWLTKAALKHLNASSSEKSDGACRDRSVYLALAELASDTGSPTFKATKALLAYRAGVSIRTVQRVLPDLERAGLLHVERAAAGIKTASTYSLLSVSNTEGLDGLSSSHTVSTIGQIRKQGQLADRVEEQAKEETKETQKKRGGGRAIGVFDSGKVKRKTRRLPGEPVNWRVAIRNSKFDHLKFVSDWSKVPPRFHLEIRHIASEYCSDKRAFYAAPI